MKRQSLLVEAMKHVKEDVKLVIAGPPDTPNDKIRIETLVADLNLTNRVTLNLRFLPREVYADYLRFSAAVAYIPFQEDAFSYVAMEAACASKALITTDDSGGVLGMINDGQTGWVSKPNPQSIAWALDQIYSGEPSAVALGANSQKFLDSMGISWSKTIVRLLE
jgi:glycosyltransferase involved in cell wall biosynthesis